MSYEISNLEKLPGKPLVSVYMLAYKHERFISKAIEGVLEQRCDFPFELIIGEDCSPDRTRSIVADYQSLYPEVIRIITADRNVGAHANSARCRNACRGRYIAICEGDDFWCCPEKLQMQVALMESMPRLSLCHTDFNRLTRFGLSRDVHRNSNVPPAQGKAYESLLCDWTVMTATSMYRRDVIMEFMQTPFYTAKWPFGDLNLLLFASLQGDVGYIDRTTATFRKTRGSSTNSGFRARLRMRKALAECVDMYIDTHPPADPGVSLAAKSTRWRRVYEAALMAGDVSTMEECRRWFLGSGQQFDEGRHRRWLKAIRLRWPHGLITGIRSTVDNLSAV